MSVGDSFLCLYQTVHVMVNNGLELGMSYDALGLLQSTCHHTDCGRHIMQLPLWHMHLWP